MRKIYFALVLSLFLLTLVNAQPPHTDVIIEFDRGLVIVDAPQTYLEQGEPYIVNFFVYNKTNGDLIDNTTTSCNLYVGNSKGELVYSDEVDYKPEEYWGETLNASVFNEVGQYQYGIKCQSNNEGGSTVGLWIVTPSGFFIEESSAIIIIGSLFVMLLMSLGFFYLGNKTENVVAKISFFSIAGIVFLMVTLFTVVTIQQALYGVDSIVLGIETFLFVVKTLVTIGGLAFGIVIFLIMMKAWKIKKGQIDEP